MNVIKAGPWTLEVDVEQTKKFYQAYHDMRDDCDCESCTNYVLACDGFPQEIKEFFHMLGIDPKKEGEVSEYEASEDKTHLYAGFYHIAGRILDGPEFLIPSTKGRDVYHPRFAKFLTMDIGFHEEPVAVPDGFPKPVLQFEFRMKVQS